MVYIHLDLSFCFYEPECFTVHIAMFFQGFIVSWLYDLWDNWEDTICVDTRWGLRVSCIEPWNE